jgi:hypothetical protein
MHDQLQGRPLLQSSPPPLCFGILQPFVLDNWPWDYGILEQNLENLRRNCYAPHIMCKTNVLRSPGAQPCVPSKATFPIVR